MYAIALNYIDLMNEKQLQKQIQHLFVCNALNKSYMPVIKKKCDYQAQRALVEEGLMCCYDLKLIGACR